MVVLNGPWQEHLHHRNEKILQTRVFFFLFFPESWFTNISLIPRSDYFKNVNPVAVSKIPAAFPHTIESEPHPQAFGSYVIWLRLVPSSATPVPNIPPCPFRSATSPQLLGPGSSLWLWALHFFLQPGPFSTHVQSSLLLPSMSSLEEALSGCCFILFIGRSTT